MFSNSRHHDLCYEVAVIKEGPSKRSLTVCSGEPREKVVYVSSTNMIEVYFVSRRLLTTLGAFLMKYEGRFEKLPKYFLFV